MFMHRLVLVWWRIPSPRVSLRRRSIRQLPLGEPLTWPSRPLWSRTEKNSQAFGPYRYVLLERVCVA